MTTREASLHANKDTNSDVSFASGPPQVSTSSSSDGNHILFPFKLHKVLDDADNLDGGDATISWMPDGKAFKIHDRERFASETMPLYFSTSKLRSFQKNLNLWGFTTPSKGDFRGGRGSVWFHPLFQRDSPSICNQMKRVVRKSAPRSSANNSSPTTTHAFRHQSMNGPAAGLYYYGNSRLHRYISSSVVEAPTTIRSNIVIDRSPYQQEYLFTRSLPTSCNSAAEAELMLLLGGQQRRMMVRPPLAGNNMDCESAARILSSVSSLLSWSTAHTPVSFQQQHWTTSHRFLAHHLRRDMK
jgi:hypothetical protein